MRWVYRTATVQAHVHEGISIWRPVGVITPELLSQVLVHAFAWHEEARAGAHLADYRYAVMAASLETFIAQASALIKPPRAIAAPMVIVPSREQLCYFRKYAIAMCSRGVGRVVMTDYERALSWARGLLQAPPEIRPALPDTAMPPVVSTPPETHPPSRPPEWPTGKHPSLSWPSL